MINYGGLSINVKKDTVACKLGRGDSFPSPINGSEKTEDPESQVTNIWVELKTAKVFHKVLNLIKSDDNLFQDEDFELLGEILNKILFGKRAGDVRNLVVKNMVTELKDKNTLYRIFLDCTPETDLNMMALPWEYIRFKYKGESEKDVISCFMAADLDSRFQFIRRFCDNEKNNLDKPSEEGDMLNVVVLFSGGENTDIKPEIRDRSKEIKPVKTFFETLKNDSAGKLNYRIIEDPRQSSFYNDIVASHDEMQKENGEKQSKFIIHYIGHSTLIDQRGKLVMKFPDGLVNWMDDFEFAKAFKMGKRCRPDMMIFQSCDSGKIGVIDSKITGLAACMVSEKIESVIGMQNEIDTDTTLGFFKMFYEAILKGSDVSEAVTIGRHYLGQPQGSTNHYKDNSFGSPVLFITTEIPPRLLKLPSETVKTIRMTICPWCSQDVKETEAPSDNYLKCPREGCNRRNPMIATVKYKSVDQTKTSRKKDPKLATSSEGINKDKDREPKKLNIEKITPLNTEEKKPD